ncbi:MAG: hypothetical protein Q9190_002386 [Brigantiaea leucoxantha]
MALLLSLANELLLRITDIVGPLGIESWTLTCHRVFELGLSALETHRMKKRRYGTIKLSVAQMQHPTLSLHDVVTNEDLQWYSRRLCLEDCIDRLGRDNSPAPRDFRTKAIEFVLSHCERIEPLFKSMPDTLRNYLDHRAFRHYLSMRAQTNALLSLSLLHSTPHQRDYIPPRPCEAWRPER